MLKIGNEFVKQVFGKNGVEVEEMKKKDGTLLHKRIRATFFSQGGTIVPFQTRTWGVENILEPTPPTKQGYIFKGWFSATSGGTQATFPILAGSNDINYYAQWEEEIVLKTEKPTARVRASGGTATHTITNKDADFADLYGGTVNPPNIFYGNAVYNGTASRNVGSPANFTEFYSQAKASGKLASDVTTTVYIIMT